MKRKDGKPIFKKFISKEVLDKLYNKKFLRVHQIADKLKVNVKTITRYMNIHQIPRRHKNWDGYKRIGFSGRHHTLEVKKKMREGAQENPMKFSFWSGKKNPEHSKWVKEFYKKHPEKHPLRILARNGRVSKPQKELFFILKQIYSNAKLNYKIPNTSRFADVGIPSLKIDYEYDEPYWHQDKKQDSIRDKELKKEGWQTIRINEKALNQLLVRRA
jgi:very-short-patch-repair endonuclease